MWKRSLLVLASLAIACPSQVHAWPLRIGIGLNLGIPIGGYYAPYPYAYPYYPAYPPVVVQQPPVVVSSATPPSAPPTVVGTPPPYNASDPIMPMAMNAVPQSANYERPGVDGLLAKLAQSDEGTRRDAVMDLGRMRADRAIDPLTSILANDTSAAVRDSAARALGLIGSSRSLPPLVRAAQGDYDRDVRHSAQFAVEIIRSQMQR